MSLKKTSTIKKEARNSLTKYGWDVKKVRQMLERYYSSANAIVYDCDDKYLYAIVYGNLECAIDSEGYPCSIDKAKGKAKGKNNGGKCNDKRNL